jgi:hypothetical protein
MTNGLKEVIKQLRQQRSAIDAALLALERVDSPDAEKAAPASASAPVGRRRGRRRKGGMTPEGRRRLSEALKARWAAKKAGSQVAAAPARAKRKGGMTPEGRKRLSEALKKRWAAKKAAAGPAAKRGGRK